MVSKKDINMPALSSTMKEGKIVAWNKKVGDKVSSGDILLVVESDKADMDVESFEDGYLAAIYTPEGGTALVGSAVATLVDTFADIQNIGSSSNSPSPVVVAPVATTAVITTDAPKIEKLLMPALSSTMKEGKVVSWSKKVGDKITSGEIVLVVESDKADMDVESYEDGYLAKIVVADGEVALVGSPVGYLAKSVDEISKVQQFLSSGSAVSTATTNTVSTTTATSAPTTTTTISTPVIVNDGRVAASGYAQAVAKEQGIDLKTVTPSRPDGYIVSKDLSTASTTTTTTTPAYVSAPGVINATPTAKKYAVENNIDLKSLKGSGNFGRVTG
jgi:pyruvate dehydrogenase E2 component (dihydrolipoamide acetyltransferase)